jgi:lipopolysaccharide transport system ATP-binding protein
LDNVSFEVKEGEVLGIIGRNGAGKSTLLKILSQVTTPTSGQIKIKGRIASLLEVGTGFHPELTGRENIFLNGAILGMTKAEIRKKFDEIVDFSGVEQFIDTPVKRYSSGMYVRLAFAVAAHLEPEILIVDEVLAVGDAEFQKKCLGKMKDVSGREGRTVLFVSHNMAAVTSLTKRCVFMMNGKAHFLGTTSDAIRHYMGSGHDNSLIYQDNEAATTSQPRIRSVQLKTSLPGNVHINNAPLEILINVVASRPVKQACLSVQIFDSELVNQVHVWNYNINLDQKSGNYTIKCLIPRFRLYMGNYRLRLFFTEPPGGENFQTLDGICPFEVIMRDTARLFQWWPKECAYLEECQWDINA